MEGTHESNEKEPVGDKNGKDVSKKRKVCSETHALSSGSHQHARPDESLENVSKKPRKGKPGFDRRMFEETSCLRKNGLRYVQPYFFTFTAHCKGRWMGKTLIDIFKKEFRMKTVEYYEQAIKNGKITVNDEIVSKNTIMTSNHIIKTQVHRHEPPVIDKPFEFIENSDLMVVIDKPSSIPVHPCGRYRHNTVVFILGEDYGLTNLHTIHRIDRLTSGILMFAKTKQKAQELEQCVKGRLVKKEYLCRVEGKFPEEYISCNQPIKVVSHKVGVCQVDPEGKEATTGFQFQSYNGHSSVVRCIPHTGRMHQIRVHLQYLGFPIVNDPVYNHPTAWGLNKGKGGTDTKVDDVIAVLAATRKDRPCLQSTEQNSEKNHSNEVKEFQADGRPCLRSTEPNSEKNRSNEVKEFQADGRPCHKSTEQNSEKNPSNEVKADGSRDESELHITKTLLPDNTNSVEACSQAESNSSITEQPSFDPDCSDCQNPLPEPKNDELVMYLHALVYKGPGWEYETTMPEWADADWHEILN